MTRMDGILVLTDDRVAVPAWFKHLPQRIRKRSTIGRRRQFMPACNVSGVAFFFIDVSNAFDRLASVQDWLDVLDDVRCIRAKTDAPILVLSPSANEARAIEMYEAGIDEYVVKPLVPSLVTAKVLAWLRWTGHILDAETDPSNSRIVQ